MIIDCHGHYTTTPPGVGAWRDAQKEAVASNPDHISERGVMTVTDDEIRESIATNQLRVQQNAAPMSPYFRRGPAGWAIMSAMPAHHRHGPNIAMS